MPSARSYYEGTCFGVPLRTGGFGIGIATRLDGKGIVFGYFFGPRRERLPHLAEIEGSVAPEVAVLSGMFGDLHLLDGRWPIIGTLSAWVRDEWVLPPMVRIDDRSGRAFLSVYANDTLALQSEEECSPELAQVYPYDRLMGAGSVEIRLTKVLVP